MSSRIITCEKNNFIEVLKRLKYVSNARFDYEISEMLGFSKEKFATIKFRGQIPRTEIELWAVKNGKSLPWILTGEGDPLTTSHPITQRSIEIGDFTPIPKVTGHLSGGPGSWELSPDVERYYAFRTDWLKSKGTIAYMKLMAIRGDSMFPTLQDGDSVLIDESQNAPMDGQVMAIMVDREALVKRIRMELDGRISVIGDNERHPRPPMARDDVVILGRVVWLGREL